MGTGSATCYALNKGKSSIGRIVVRIENNAGFSNMTCSNVAPAAVQDSLCSLIATLDYDHWCRVEITGGSAKDVITRFNVEDADGSTILSLGPE